MKSKFEELDKKLEKAKKGREFKKAIKALEKISLKRETQMFYFGGFLRDLWLNKEARDIDIIVNCLGAEERIERIFGNYVKRVNRFGGYKLDLGGVEVDIWPAEDCYIFQEGFMPSSINRVPETAFFTLESIVFEVAKVDGTRLGWEDGFFDACERREIEIRVSAEIQYPNPFPDLQIARAFNLRRKLGWGYGPHLKRYISERLTQDNQSWIDMYKEVYGSDNSNERLNKELGIAI